MTINSSNRQMKNNFTVSLLKAAEWVKTWLLFVVVSFFANTALAQNPCSIVKVKTYKQVGTTSYYQEGVGWVYDWQSNDKLSKSKNLKVVAPAHVVFEGNRIVAECNNFSMEMYTKGISPSLDLAVLESKDLNTKFSNNFKPLFELSANLSPVNIDESILKENTAGFPVVVHFKNSSLTYTNLGVVTEKLKSQFNYQFPQYHKSILNTAGGIRPGMSGSPLYAPDSKLPVGMNLKTKINDHVSLVLPTEELIQFLPSLEKRIDPWTTKHPLFEIGFFHAYDSTTKSLQRYRQLLIKNEKGQVIQKYMEPCQFGAMVETSTWQPTGGGGSWGDSGGGGSWGDSGGGAQAKQKKNSYYTGDLKLPHGGAGKYVDLARDLMYSGLNQYFLSKNVCEKEGLIEAVSTTGLKKILVGSGINMNGDLFPTKIDDVESLLLVLLANEKIHEPSLKNIYAGEESANLKLICNEKIMGRKLKAYGSQVDESELTRYIPTRLWNDFDVNKFFKQNEDGGNNHMLLM